MKNINGIMDNPDLTRNILRKIKEGEMTTFVVNNHDIKNFMRSKLDINSLLNTVTTLNIIDNENSFKPNL